MIVRNERVVKPLCIATALLALTTAALAQTPNESAAHQNDVLRSRNRATMHEGDPLVISGIEQNDNDIRSATPALAHGEKAAVLVDTDENYRRTMALYEDRATYSSGLTIVSGPQSMVGRRGQGARGAAPETAGPTLDAWPIVLGVAGFATAFVLLARRRVSTARVGERAATAR